MLHAAKNLYRSAVKKADFHWNNLLTRSRYAMGRRRFPANRKKGLPLLRELGVLVLRGQTPDHGIALPPDFLTTVNGLAAEVEKRFATTSCCIFRSADDGITRRLAMAAGLPERTADVPEVRRGEVAMIRLRQTRDLPGLAAIADALIPQIEDRVFHAPVTIEKIMVYRHAHSVLPEFSSVLWHSDNHFEGVMKIMVYLTDVTAETAPFTYLRHKETQLPIHIPPHWPQAYPYGRVPDEVIAGHESRGYETFPVTGPKGTTLLFDDKIIHKGNYAIRGYRDVLVFQLRPAASLRGRSGLRDLQIE